MSKHVEHPRFSWSGTRTKETTRLLFLHESQATQVTVQVFSDDPLWCRDGYLEMRWYARKAATQRNQVADHSQPETESNTNSRGFTDSLI